MVARARAGAAADILQKVLRAESAAAPAGQRKELFEKIKRAENLRRGIEQGSAEAKKELPEPVLRELEKLDEAERILRGARELNAVAIAMNYSPGRSDGVSLGGKPLSDGERVLVPDGARLEICGIGQLDIYPGQQPDGETLAETEGELARALEAVGTRGIEDARASAHRRVEAEQRARNAVADLGSLAPDETGALRDQLAAIPEPIDSEEDLPAVEEARQEDDAARGAHDKAAEDHDAARTTHGHAQTVAARAAADAENAGTRKARAKGALSGIEDPEAERTVRWEALSRLREELKDAIRQREEMEAAAPDLEAARLALERARSIVERADRDRLRIREDLKGLDASIDIYAGDAVDEELVDVDVRLAAARTELDATEFEVAVLQTLGGALETARESARDRYVEPVMKELVALLRDFLPEAEVRFDPETLLPKALVRAGTEEDFHILSGGTQEQIALLVRLAFARILARTGTAVPVILDDAIVHTDDNRIELMFDTLTRQTQDLQIVELSCRQRAFRDLGGRGLAIEPAMRT